MAFLLGDILERVKAIFSSFPLLRAVFCRKPMAFKLF